MVIIPSLKLGPLRTPAINFGGAQPAGPPRVAVDDLALMDDFLRPLSSISNTVLSPFDGDKFIGGFGHTKVFLADYWLLRQRSDQLFKENLYARGLVRRLITNEINTGLNLEAVPNTDILGLGDNFRNDWSANN